MTQRALMGIIFALDAEAKTAARWQGASQALCRITGPGETPAADGARALLAAGAGALVSWGTSGALSTSLQAGQILLLRTTGRLGEPRLTADPQWQEMIRYNPIRAQHEFVWYLESRFPGQKVEVLNVGWQSRVLAFDSGPLQPGQVAPQTYP